MLVRSKKLLTLVLGFAICLAFGTSANAATRAEAYSGIGGMRNVEIAPDGMHISAVETYDGREAVFVYGLGPNAGQSQVLAIPDKYPDDLRIMGATWVNNKRLLVYLKFANFREFGSVTEYRRLGVDINGSNVEILPKVIRQEERPVGAGGIYDWLPNDPDHVLISYYKPRSTNGSVPFKMNVNDGKLYPVAQGDWNIGGYVADLEGNTRLREVYDDLKTKVQVRASEGKPWETIWEYESFKDPYFNVLSFTKDPNKILVASDRETGSSSVFEFDIAQKSFGRKIWSNPRYDADRIEFSNDGKILAVGYYADTLQYDALDGNFGSKMGVLQQAFAGNSIWITSKTRDESKWLVGVSGPEHPTAYYLFDTVNIKLSAIGKVYPDVPKGGTSAMMPISYQARDGLNIPAYLTLPKGGSGPYPLVVYPHGGPYSRDAVEFHPVAQFMASSGYAVFQPNFRGSSGFGSSFEAKGYKEWGLKMQDDITDGVQFLIDQGMVDPNRICIVGWSYGGYAALMGAIKTPDMFKCVVAGAAVTDIPLFKQQRFHSDFYKHAIGSFKDRAQLKETSPARNVDSIKAPVLLVHGTHDQTVMIEQSRLMAGKLRGANKPHKLLVLDKDDHHRSVPANDVLFMQELEAFLAQHLR